MSARKKELYSSAVLFSAGILALLAALGMYRLGLTGDPDYQLFENAYLLAMGAVALLSIGLTLLAQSRGRTRWVKTGIGCLLVIVAGGLFLANYPQQWDAPDTIVTELFILLYVGGLAAILEPAIRTIVSESSVTGIQRHGGRGAVIGSVVLGSVSYLLYLSTQFGTGVTGVRSTALITALAGMVLFPIGLALLLATSRVQVLSVLAAAGPASAPFIIFVHYYPTHIHTTSGSDLVLTLTLYAGLITLVGYTALLTFLAVTLADREFTTPTTVAKLGLRQKVYNADENRVRTPFRILIGFGIFLLVNTVLTFTIALPLGSFLESLTGVRFDVQASLTAPHTWLEWIMRSVFALFASYTIAFTIVSKYIDKRDPRKLLWAHDDMSFDWRYLLSGLGIGMLTATAIVVIYLLSGWATISLNPAVSPSYLLLLGGLFLVTAPAAFTAIYPYTGWWVTNFTEGMRGYIGSQAATGIGILTAGIMIAVFGVPFGFINYVQIITFLYFISSIAVAHAVTGRGVFALGILWGFWGTTIVVFDLPFLYTLEDTLFTLELVGPITYTGGVHGPSGGLVGLLVFLTTTLAIYDLNYLIDAAPEKKFRIGTVDTGISTTDPESETEDIPT